MERDGFEVKGHADSKELTASINVELFLIWEMGTTESEKCCLIGYAEKR